MVRARSASPKPNMPTLVLGKQISLDCVQIRLANTTKSLLAIRERLPLLEHFQNSGASARDQLPCDQVGDGCLFDVEPNEIELDRLV